jgi:hypothetical protein
VERFVTRFYDLLMAAYLIHLQLLEAVSSIRNPSRGDRDPHNMETSIKTARVAFWVGEIGVLIATPQRLAL